MSAFHKARAGLVLRGRAALLAVSLALCAPAGASELHDRMRERFPMYYSMCRADAACVVVYLTAWFGRNFELHTVAQKTGVYLVWRDATGIREYVLIGEMEP